MGNYSKRSALHKKAVAYLTTSKIQYGDELPPMLLPDEEAKIRKDLISADPDERMRIDLEVARLWHMQMQLQHTDLLSRRAHLMESAQASTIQHISIAMGISADKIEKSAERIAEMEARLGEGEVIEPARKIRIQGGGEIQG
jgi:hypothetical protein